MEGTSVEARRWLTIEQAAEYLASKVATVRSAYYSGLLQACRLGKRLIFDKADLDRFAEGRKERMGVGV